MIRLQFPPQIGYHFPMRNRMFPLLCAMALPTLAAPPSDSGPYAAAIALPISIQNEVDVAIENGRAYLAAHQSDDGLWGTGQTDASSLPAFAFLEPPCPGAVPAEPLRRAAQAAFLRLSATSPFVQHPDANQTMAEDALVVAAALSVFDASALLPDNILANAETSPLLPVVRRRLAAISPDSQPPATVWLCRTSLDLLGGSPSDSTLWAPLYTGLAHTASPRPRDVALAGYARIRHGQGSDSANALLAYLRWLRVHTDIFSDAASSSTPEDLYFLTAFLDALPPALPARAGIPANWRTRAAQHLIATARSSDGTTHWPADTEPDILRQTLFAVATLVGL